MSKKIHYSIFSPNACGAEKVKEFTTYRHEDVTCQNCLTSKMFLNDQMERTYKFEDRIVKWIEYRIELKNQLKNI
jgi:hypothetical protein